MKYRIGCDYQSPVSLPVSKCAQRGKCKTCMLVRQLSRFTSMPMKRAGKWLAGDKVHNFTLHKMRVLDCKIRVCDNARLALR